MGANVTPRERFTGATVRLGPQMAAAQADGTSRFRWCELGMPEMDPEDWRQWEITAENARAMVDRANAAIAAGTELWINYGHNEYGPRGADALRFELEPDGIYGVVRWNDTARDAIKQDPPAWKYFSPEWYCTRVFDSNGSPKYVNGREVIQPFELAGGALTNVPSMVGLAVAAQREPKSSPPEASNRKEMAMKKLAKLLGLADGASEEEIEKAVTQKLEAEKSLESRLESFEAKLTDGLKKLEAGTPSLAQALAAEAAKLNEQYRFEARREAFVATSVKRGLVTVAARPHLEKLSKGGLEPAEALEACEKLVAELAAGRAPVGRVYEESGQDAHSEFEDAVDFKTANLEDPKNRAALAAAARKLAAEKTIGFDAAVAQLTGTADPAAAEN